MEQVKSINPLDSNGLESNGSVGNPSQATQLLYLQLVAAFSAISQAFAEQQTKAAKESAEETDKSIAEGQDAAQETSSNKSSHSSKPATASNSIAETSAVGGFSTGVGAGSTL
ncbi:MAG: hypothetical protein S4CHLAM7_04710 [Chlamydiae bacterium]|nr:hypothetical protein [Chlamydiota bacterium]